MSTSIGIGMGVGLDGIGGGQSSTFVPTQIAGLVGWYKSAGGTFQDNSGGTTTPATANNDPVGTWVDQSGNSNNLTVAAANQRPLLQTAVLNGKPTVLFDGINDSLSKAFTLTQPTTVYITFRQITWGNQLRISDGGVLNSMINIQNSASPQISLYAGTGFGPDTTDLAVNTFGILTSIFNGASSVIQVNNVAQATGNPGTADPGGFTLGMAATAGIGFSNIEVAEALVYNTVHNAGNRTLIKNYLASRYGLSI